MNVGAYFDKLIEIAVAIFVIYIGIRFYKKSPDKTIKLFKDRKLKLGKFLAICGIVFLVIAIIRFFL